MSRWTADCLIGLMIGFIAGGVVGWSRLWYGALPSFTGIPAWCSAFSLSSARTGAIVDEDAIELRSEFCRQRGRSDRRFAHTSVAQKSGVQSVSLVVSDQNTGGIDCDVIFALLSQGGGRVVYCPFTCSAKDTFGLSSGFVNILAGRSGHRGHRGPCWLAVTCLTPLTGVMPVRVYWSARFFCCLKRLHLPSLLPLI